MLLRVAALLLCLAAAACESRDSRPAVPPRVQADEPVGEIEAVEGEAYLRRDGARSDAKPGAALRAGDNLETGAQGKMRVRLRDDSKLSLGARTQVGLRQLLLEEDSRTGWIDVRVGRFWFHVTKWMGKGASRYDVATPDAVAGVRGTTLWGDTEFDAICALEGEIDVRSLRDRTLPVSRLEAGNCAAALSKGKLEPLAPTTAEVERFLAEVLIRGR